MGSEPNQFRKARYYSSVAVVYLLTLLFGGYAFYPSLWPKSNLQVEALKPYPNVVKKTTNLIKIISGTPVRIVIPSLNIDLPVDPGLYDPTNNSWTLSGYHAQYATITPLANDHSGNTFIYGHRNKYVFLYLRKISPGDQALIYTDNQHIFSYTYNHSTEVSPDDTSVLTYQGPPILTIQTCSGNWNEKRQMFIFNFDKVQ